MDNAEDILSTAAAWAREGEQVAIATDVLTLQPSSNDAAVQAKLHDYASHSAKWQSELDEDQQKAHDLEAEVALAETKAGRFDLGEALLQIAVVLASITLLTRRQDVHRRPRRRTGCRRLRRHIHLRRHPAGVRAGALR